MNLDFFFASNFKNVKCHREVLFNNVYVVHTIHLEDINLQKSFRFLMQSGLLAL